LLSVVIKLDGLLATGLDFLKCSFGQGPLQPIMNCPTPHPSSANCSQSCNFLQHLQMAVLVRKTEMLPNLATCLATSVSDVYRMQTEPLPPLKRKCFWLTELESAPLTQLLPQPNHCASTWPAGASSLLQLMVPALQTSQRRVTPASHCSRPLVLVLFLCPAMALFDCWTAVSRSDATWYYSQEIPHLQAQAMSQEDNYKKVIYAQSRKSKCWYVRAKWLFYSEKKTVRWEQMHCAIDTLGGQNVGVQAKTNPTFIL